MVRYAILGPVELCNGTRRVAVRGSGQAALLALLLVNANQVLSSDRLIDVLSGDRASGAALKRLQMAIVRLRRMLDGGGAPGESVLRTVAGGYVLAVEPGQLDAEVFQTRMQDGRRALEAGDAKRAREMFGEALGLWRGPALAQVAYQEFAQAEIRRLEELRLCALEMRVDCELRLGMHGTVISELEALVGAYPGHERLAALLMLALYRCGRQGDALDVYTRTRAYLARELGLEPGPGLRGLQGDILAHSPILQPVGAAALLPPAAQAATEEPDGAAWAGELPLPRPLRVPTGSLFVGRDVELACLREHWTGRGGETRSAVMLGGEAGIGKTRLTAELARTVHAEGGLVLYGRCDEGLAVPYQPFVEALRPYATAVGVDRLRAELGHLAPELRRMLPELGVLGEPLRSDPESERFALFEAVAALLEAMTRQRPALLILDDLHWASQPTLQLARHVIRSARPLRVLLLGIYRDTELDLDQPLAHLLADLHRDASAQRLSIRGLDEDAIAALLEAAVGRSLDRGAAQLVHALADQTAGNPFYLCELLADLLESGTISSEHVSARATASQLKTPEPLRQVIAHRITRLSEPAVQTLRIAAVAGPTFSFVLLDRVLGDRTTVLDALDEALAARLLIAAGNGDYAFAHAIVRHTIYDELNEARRIHLHRKLGEALETLDDPDTHIEALAHHFAQAAVDGQAGKAADYALAAGHSASARVGYEEAAAHYERGLAALARSGQPEGERHIELLLALGEARWGTGEFNKAKHAYLRSAELAGDRGDATGLARAAIGFCGPHRIDVAAAATTTVVELLERALAALSDEDSALRAQLTARMAAGLAYRNIEDGKAALVRQALEMARRVGDKATLADVLATVQWATRGPDALHENVLLAEELGRLADEICDLRGRAMAHAWLLEHLLEQGDIDAVEHELDALRRLADTRSEPYFKWISAGHQANHAFLQGRLEDCERLARDALAHRIDSRDELATHQFGAQLFLIRTEQGRLHELVEETERTAARHPELPGWRCILAHIYAQLRRRTETRRQLEILAPADFSVFPRDGLWLSTISVICNASVFVGDALRARQLYELLSPYAGRYIVTYGVMCQGSVARQLGLLAMTLSRYDDAERHFQQALKMNTQIRSPLWIAHTQHDYARMLLARARSGDNHKAYDLLDRALATADQLGLKALADKTRPLTLPARAARPPQTLRKAA